MAATRTIRLPVLGAAPVDEPRPSGLLDRLLREQQELTAVERFAQRHAGAGPLLEPIYRARLPASPPGPGQQYAFEVDLDACSGCKACVAACHRLNGLDPGETWRTVGTLHGGGAAAPVLKTVTSACHHCVDPACLAGCPVDAYEKDPVTGIVRHLDDQCIGCRYCTLTCPYEVPQFSAARGIVRKCDMCSDRLGAGEAPACVQACPSGAIAIKVVDVAAAIEDAQGEAFLPGAPSPAITVPTTTYVSAEPLPRNLLPADFYAVRPAHAHAPLVVMLVLTQLAVGALVVDRVLAALTPTAAAPLAPVAAGLALGTALVALAASTLHLGRPRFAFRAVLGVRTSWVSREILAFGAFAAAASAHALGGGRWPAIGAAAALLGVAGVASSVMLYAVTHRAWWGLGRTLARFTGTLAVLGLAAVLVVAAATGATDLADALAAALIAAVAIKLAIDLAVLVHLRDRVHGELKRTAILLTTQLRGVLFARVTTATLGAVLALVAVVDGLAAVPAGFALAALVAGELLERTLFFVAASAPRMPGTFR